MATDFSDESADQFLDLLLRLEQAEQGRDRRRCPDRRGQSSEVVLTVDIHCFGFGQSLHLDFRYLSPLQADSVESVMPIFVAPPALSDGRRIRSLPRRQAASL